MKATCPKCHKTFEIPDDKPDSMKCLHCNATLAFKYSDEEDEAEQEPEKVPFKVKAKNFWNKHKVKIIAGATIAVGVIVTVFLCNKNSKDSEESSPQLPDFLPKPEPNNSIDTITLSDNEPAENEVEEYQDDEYCYDYDDEEYSDDEEFDCEEWGILGYLSNYCYNCGAKLSNGLYTDPWEDGSNEYGYWVCPCCGALNEDYNSADY